FANILRSYRGTWDSFFHRMTQIFPTFFNLDKMFFIRFGQDTATDLYDITSELHLSELHNPHGVRSLEHYCRRWITIKLLSKLSSAPGSEGDVVSGFASAVGPDLDMPVIGVQKVRFFQSENEYICFTMAKRELHAPMSKTSLTVGLLITPLLKEKILFIDDPNIPFSEVSITCERCGIEDCEVRAAPPTLYENELKLRSINQSIEDLIQDNSN
ncbi:MAG: hypothetical protein HQK53_13950, partial [Oligoflexia bacterium]|nr:hypothetical protein [Oligoflexia bacterium]